LTCDHRFCTECFTGYCESKINDAAVSLSSDLVCPIRECKHPLTIDLLKGNLETETFTKYERFMMRGFAEENNCCFCPASCGWYIDIDVELDEENLDVWKKITCGNPECKKEFCGSCLLAPHRDAPLNMSCKEFAESVRANSSTGASDDMFSEYLKTSENKTQSCPQCNCIAELESGCKFVYCRCKSKFCFICGVTLFDPDHTRHFTGDGLGGPYGTTCKGPKDKDLTPVKEKKK
jgi:hypothetical protein